VNKAIKFSIGLVFSIVGMVYAFRQFNWIEFIDSLRGVNYWYLLGAMSLQLGAVWLRALRWKWLLVPIKNVPVRITFDATIIGYFGNSVLPVRMGELLRAYVVANNSTLSVAQVIGSLIVERMLDILGVVILALIFLINFDIINIPNWIIFSIVLITITLFGLLFLISSKKNNWQFIKKRKYLFQSKIGSKIYDVLKNIVTGLSVINHAPNKIGVYGFIFVLWGMYYLSFIFVVNSVNLGLNWVDSGVLFLLLSLAISIPAAPGYIGTYHATCVGALTTIYNIGLGESQAFAVLAHAMMFVPIVIVGSIFFLKNSMKFSKLKSLETVES
jgi:uncharacterized protein (TIRG00374 family)